MHSAVAAALAASLIAGPTVLAFFSGGYFERPRLIAGILAWVAVLAAVVVARRPLPRASGARLALAGLAGLCVWTALSLLWTPIAGATEDDLQRVLLYLAYFGACVVLFRAAWVSDRLEPALAAGTVIVTCYALSERLLPDLIDLSGSVTAGGRLEQPLTYWNASGALAALGVVLCVRLVGDKRRDARLRAAAAAATVPLAAGIYLSLSRGVLAALTVGLSVLVAVAPDGRAQLRAVAIALVTSVPAAVVAGALPAVRTLDGSAAARRAEGLVMLAVLAALAAAAALLARREARSARPSGGPLRARHRALATAGVGLVLGGALLGAAALESKPKSRSPAFGANPERLQSLDSNRYSYWRVALDTFSERPVLGIGSGAFVVEWLQQRDVDDPTREPHSLYLETLAELGLVGFAALAAFVGGVAAAARELWRRDPGLAAGPIAALVLFAAHAGIDWDWEMPALTLVALALAGAAVAWGDMGMPSAAIPDRREGSAPAPAHERLASAPGRGGA
ncbi:MAG TPA: O-antigen ligase family protein [Thermoleophilaceae bacterium]|nr:O-antigen ligase family protein [Thermoleophilaceae bacterium]